MELSRADTERLFAIRANEDPDGRPPIAPPNLFHRLFVAPLTPAERLSKMRAQQAADAERDRQRRALCEAWRALHARIVPGEEDVPWLMALEEQEKQTGLWRGKVWVVSADGGGSIRMLWSAPQPCQSGRALALAVERATALHEAFTRARECGER